MKIGSIWLKDGMRKWEVILSRALRSLICAFSILFGLYLPETHSQIPDQQKGNATGGPVTNESVEAGFRKLREALRTTSEFQANDARTHLRLAKIFSQQGDPNGAIEEFQTIIQLNPASAEAYRELGAVYLDKHEWGKAQQALGMGVELNSQDHQAFYWLGRSLMAQNHCFQASEAFATATILDSNNASIYSDLGLALMAQGKIEDAKKALKQAIRLQPDLAEAHHRLEEVRAAQDNPQHLIQSAQHILHALFRRE